MKILLCKKVSDTTIIQFVIKDSVKELLDFKGDASTITVRYDNTTTNIYGGLGEPEKFSYKLLRKATALALQKACALSRTHMCIVPPEALDESMAIDAIIEGVLLGSYSFTKYKSETKTAPLQISIVSKKYSQKRLEKISSICNGTNYARTIVNENAHIVTPEYLANEARALAKKQECSLTILNENELSKKGLNLLCAVGSGSKTPPRLILLHYKTAQPNAPTIALVGKGITFDSGGQNLKPSGSIETMRCDMAGAAAVLGFFSTLSTLKPNVNIVGVIPTAHNGIDAKAYFPGDIYTAYNKKTVEITNTDAEGRLILADAISYALKNYPITSIVDLATLTGGILIALGDTIAGIFSNNNALAEGLFSAGETSGERLWRFPLYEEFTEAIKSDCADLRNTAKLKKGYASSLTGAAFIQEFVEGVAWAHLDIAGVAFNEGEAKGDIPRYATGFGVRLLAQYISSYLNAE